MISNKTKKSPRDETGDAFITIEGDKKSVSAEMLSPFLLLTVNYGRISDTHLTGFTVIRNDLPTGEIVHSFGLLSSTVRIACGAIAGVDHGDIELCSGADRLSLDNIGSCVSEPYGERWACRSVFALYVSIEDDFLVGSYGKDI